MDNLGFQKSERTVSLIAQAGVEIHFLPDLNPIEMMWSKVWALLCKAQVAGATAVAGDR